MNQNKIKYETLKLKLNEVNKNIEDANNKLDTLMKNLDKGISTAYSTKDKYNQTQSGLESISTNIEIKYIPEIENIIKKIA